MRGLIVLLHHLNLQVQPSHTGCIAVRLPRYAFRLRCSPCHALDSAQPSRRTLAISWEATTHSLALPYVVDALPLPAQDGVFQILADNHPPLWPKNLNS